MNKFQFSMDKLLRLKENEEKYIIHKFASEKEKLILEKGTLKNLKNQRKLADKYECDKININTMLINNLYKEQLINEIYIQNEIVKFLIDELEETRQNLSNIHKEIKIMEIMKDKEFVNYRNAIHKREQKELDEITTIKKYNQNKKTY